MRTLDEIENWKLEAKSENTERYFYHVQEVGSIVRGTSAYVIGRKGTGKTAIAEYLLRLKSYDTFAEKVTFKNFPFNELYGLKNTSYTPPNEYIIVASWSILRDRRQATVRRAGNGNISVKSRKAASL